MEVLNTFGFEPGLFIAQIINFLILAYIFKRFLYKPLLGVLKQREDKIKQGLTDAEKARIALDSANEERTKILKKTRIEAEKILDDAKKLAQGAKSQILEDSKLEADKIIKEGKNQVALEMAKMEKNIGQMSLGLSKKILDNVIESLFTDKEKAGIMEKATKRLQTINLNE